ncbi:hypothetical protein LNJ08_06060 [Tenacibaculum finnmarkense genomovar ulcerans]|uniref:hypothetical protein n=1 Tax=Tenacibaculum finnmarkense TaxID=2781243 RepID=UPI001E350CB3|nr:hypothetical protein [Tenacibaculum finnmarkense]MCD8453953.1 hypothetical protein [Tenacibaculum finnmarkense genomovar ulcerans]
MRLKISLILVLLTNITLFAQVKIGDNPSDINPTSILELESTDKVFVLTRMDNTVMQSLLLNPDPDKRPLQGALVYNTTDNCVFMYNGAAWVSLCNLATSSVEVTPAATAPANPNKGDFWINTTTNQTSLFDGTNWVLLNSTTNTGSAVEVTPAATAPANPNKGDFWINTTTNQTSLFDGAAWVLLNPTTNTGSSVKVTPAATAPTANNNLGDFWINTTTNQTSLFDGAAWVLLNPTTNTTSTVEITKQATAPTLNNTKGDFWMNTTTNQTNIYNGTAWVLLNENPKKGTGVPTNITAPNSVAGDIYVDTASGTIYAHNGTAWLTQTGTSTGITQKVTKIDAIINQDTFNASNGLTLQTSNKDNITVYRNGVRVDFSLENNKTEIKLESDAKCYTGDQIRIVQIY